MSFHTIPVLDLALARDPSTKPTFLLDLRHAVLEVGFLYIKNTGIDEALVLKAIAQAKDFFDLPLEKKMEVEMKNAPSFLGYSKLGNEITRLKTDWREQIDLSTPHPLPGPAAPLYHNLLAPNQWPDPKCVPNFRPVYEEYMKQMATISMTFVSLVAEAIGLPPNAFNRFFDEDQQHKLKILKYPDLQALGVDGNVEQQGVGPHKDSMLSSYLLQASHHRGLQVQNHLGEWIDCPPIDGTFVVAIGQGLEAVTQGVCQRCVLLLMPYSTSARYQLNSTTHRVLSPAPGSGPRYSIPFFQGISYDATFESMAVPEHVKALRQEINKRNGVRQDDIEFTFSKGRWGHLGEATLINRVKSHPDVGERWYPTLLQKIREEQASNNQVAEMPQGGVKD
ncbi:hypothetical protein LOZ64_006620 [Ophidiomyces ophidiicola]|nr:hypothetical protein LOZ64_006620 [Ophidiomyces ophidiicola]KAI1921111.1 hypothetical protein LOZ60_006346 [Ophidiomyces ophidiicola]KAI2002701.1 hypothetical protein LOZ49_006219 [Ophidiomyces ophidiicola]KAI2149895.1 hypothetical protein LOZ25_006684 [Ophidiomyces ophidiicola]KAI2208161.1 hypothetical protein LOZ15_006661 [Ophidiomyces ophidiicola]